MFGRQDDGDDDHDDVSRKLKPGVGFIGKLRNYFIAGLMVTAPIGITVWLAWEFITYVDAKIVPLLPPSWNPDNYLPFSLPGLGLLVLVIALTLIGMMTAGMVGRFVMRQSERFMDQVPVVRSVYGAVKQILETVLAKKSQAFRQVVLIEYPDPGIYAIAFVTGEAKGEVQRRTEEDVVGVFLPAVPNPTTGFLLFLPKKDLHVLDMTVEEGLKLVVSGGIVVPNGKRGKSVPMPESPSVIIQRKRLSFGARMRNYFFAGVLVTAPMYISLWLAWQFISWVDARILPLLPPRFNFEDYVPFGLPGAGLIVAFIGLTFIGFLAYELIGRWVTRVISWFIGQVPVVRSVYSAIKQILDTVLATRSDAFRECVLFNYPRKGVWAIGFITGKAEGHVQGETDREVVNVFLPTTPNPTSGFLMFVAREETLPLSMSVEEGFKLVVSGGIVVPPDRSNQVEEGERPTAPPERQAS